MTEAYDFVAIGAGPAGESAAELAAFYGHRSVVIENNRPGGTVTTTGGAPTKTLRETALYLTGFCDRDVYGLHMATAPDILLPTIRKRTRDVAELLQRVTADNIAKHNVDYLQGSARLGPGRAVLVVAPDGREFTLRAKTILIATGSRPMRPKSIPFDEPGVCDSDTILALGYIPKDILIVGGGPVGVEYATICHALGARVTLVADRLMAMMDGEMSRRMDDLFRIWGLTVVLGATADTITRSGPRNLEVVLSTGAKFQPDTILFAAGRVANTEGLDLDAAGVKTDSLGRILVDEHFRTSTDSVFAAGDVLGPTLASIAMEQGRAAACHALGIPFEGTVDPTPVSAVYGMPEVAGAGLTEEQCQTEGIDYHVGRSEFDLIPRGAIAGRGGLLKLIFGGFDPTPGSLSAKFNLLGRHIYENEWFKELSFPYKKVDSLVLAFSHLEEEELKRLYTQSITNGLQNSELHILNRDQCLALEPNINPQVTAALLCTSSYIVDPVCLTSTLVQSAILNGAKIFLGDKVESITKVAEAFLVWTIDDDLQQKTFRAKFIINAAGHYADVVAAMIQDKDFTLKARRGQYRVIEKTERGIINDHILFMVPTIHGKAVIVAPMLDGHLLAGPTAEEGSLKRIPD